MKVGAALMVNNMSPFIASSIRSLEWCDAIFLFDDHSTDDTVSLAKGAARVPLICESSPFEQTAFKVGEVRVRNYIVERAFVALKCDVLMIVDGDEVFSRKTRGALSEVFATPAVDRAVFPTWHLFDARRYFRVWETEVCEVTLVDPHVRAIRRGPGFETSFADGSHPRIRVTDNTASCLGPYHFHLKYFRGSPFPNYTFDFLPKWIKEGDALPFLQELPFDLPLDIRDPLESIPWGSWRRRDSLHYSEARVQLDDPLIARIHPRDR